MTSVIHWSVNFPTKPEISPAKYDFKQQGDDHVKETSQMNCLGVNVFTITRVSVVN